MIFILHDTSPITAVSNIKTWMKTVICVCESKVVNITMSLEVKY